MKLSLIFVLFDNEKISDGLAVLVCILSSRVALLFVLSA